MVKHTQTIRRLLPTNCLSVLDHFVVLVLKGLILEAKFGTVSVNVTNNLEDLKLPCKIFQIGWGI